jgi:hypothetical protein
MPAETPRSARQPRIGITAPRRLSVSGVTAGIDAGEERL